jgi:hypothetical protein
MQLRMQGKGELVPVLNYAPRHEGVYRNEDKTPHVPDKVTEFFNSPNPSRRITALGSTQPLTEMSTRNLPGGRPAGA